MTSENLRRQLSRALDTGRPLVVRTHTFLPEVQEQVDGVLGAFLAETGGENLFDQLSFCIRELAVNAKKANTKRLYFGERNLDLGSSGDYTRGMAGFKADTLGDQGRYLSLLKERDLYVKIEFLRYRGLSSVAVRNPGEALAVEVSRVREKIARAHRYASVQDALEEALDETEGAGLGLVFLVLMLKKVGFTGEFFRFYTVGGETVARIFLPQETTWPNSGRKTPPSTP